MIDVTSQQGNEKAIGAALAEVFSDWLVNRPDVFITSRSGTLSSSVQRLPACLWCRHGPLRLGLSDWPVTRSDVFIVSCCHSTLGICTPAGLCHLLVRVLAVLHALCQLSCETWQYHPEPMCACAVRPS